jgi:hypothetical protein
MYYWREHALVLMGKCIRANMRWNLGQTVPAREGYPRPTKTTASNLNRPLALSNNILSSLKVVEAEALMHHAVPLGLVEPAARYVSFALLARSKVKLADRSGDGHGVPQEVH